MYMHMGCDGWMDLCNNSYTNLKTSPFFSTSHDNHFLKNYRTISVCSLNIICDFEQNYTISNMTPVEKLSKSNLADVKYLLDGASDHDFPLRGLG